MSLYISLFFLILINLREFNGVLLKGKRAHDGQFPWLIQFQTIAPCGGVLLSPDWVLTAAQCVQDKRNSIMLFATGLNGTGSKQTIPVKATYIYPTYEAYSVVPDRDHNVALLKLTKPFDMCPNNIALLPNVVAKRYNDDDYRLCLIFGWQSYVSPHSPKVLAKPIQYDEVILNSWKMCTYMIKTNANYTNVFCAMVEFKDEMKACAGNPGSPVICENQNRETALVGIASWTNFSFECGNLPTYIDLGPFRIWMRELVFNVKDAGEEWGNDDKLYEHVQQGCTDASVGRNRSDLLSLGSQASSSKTENIQLPNSSRTKYRVSENKSYPWNHRSANSIVNNVSRLPDGYYEMSYVDDISKEAIGNIFKYREIGDSQSNDQIVENVKDEQLALVNKSSLCDQQSNKVTVKQDDKEQIEFDDYELLLPYEATAVSRSSIIIITVSTKRLYLCIYFVSCYFYITYMQ